MANHKNREMATTPYPVGSKTRNVVVEGTWCAGSYSRRVTGKAAVIVLSDGSEVACSHRHGHKSTKTLVACATRLVRELNDAAGIPRDKQ